MKSTPTVVLRPSHRSWAWRCTLPLLAMALACTAVSSHAQWRWRDKNGGINASDRPPPRDVPDKDILSRPAPETQRRNGPVAGAMAAASGAPAASGVLGTPAKGPLDAELEARKRAADQEQAAKAKADEARLAAQRADNCRRARGQMAALETGQRMARVNEKGEREVMDDRIRADEMRQAREVIASDCR